MIGTFFQSIIFLTGILGNVLVCAVVYRTRSMHTTTNCYLVSLAVADTITLVSSVPQEILSYHILGNQWVWGQFGCSALIFLQYLGIDASALSLTAFTGKEDPCYFNFQLDLITKEPGKVLLEKVEWFCWHISTEG